jgi:hypothetical protein
MLINNQQLCSADSIKARVTRWAKLILSTHMPQGHDFETTWCLVACGVLKIKLDKNDVSVGDDLPNPIVLTLLWLLRERKLLKIRMSDWDWRAKFRKVGIYSDLWLPMYEAVSRGWTADAKIAASVKTNPLFAKMLAGNVTFIEDQIFDAKHIDIGRRVFSKIASPLAKKGTGRSSKAPRGFGGITIDISDLDY